MLAAPGNPALPTLPAGLNNAPAGIPEVLPPDPDGQGEEEAAASARKRTHSNMLGVRSSGGGSSSQLQQQQQQPLTGIVEDVQQLATHRQQQQQQQGEAHPHAPAAKASTSPSTVSKRTEFLVHSAVLPSSGFPFLSPHAKHPGSPDD